MPPASAEPIASAEQALAAAESDDARRSREGFDWLKSNPGDKNRAAVCTALLRMLNSRHQRPAGETLVLWVSAEQIPELAAALAAASAERKHDVARPIAQSLARIDDPRIYPALADYLAADFDTGFARDVLKLAGPKAAPAILPYVHDARRDVRESARALLLEDWEVDPKLLIDQTAADLSAGNAETRRTALDWINSLPQGGSLGDKLAAALDPLVRDADLEVARRAMTALKRCAASDNVPTLIATLDHADEGLRNLAKDLLVQIKDPRAAPYLARGLGGDFFQRIDARKRLHDFGPAAEAFVVPYYENKDWIARKDVCELLGEIGTRKSIPALERMTRDENLHVRNAAAKAIAAINEANRMPVEAVPVPAPSPAPPPAAEPRTWTDATGMHTIEAAFVDFKGGKVVLRKSDGSEVSLSMQQLSKADQDYIRDLLKARK
jgi:HEAT repeat protein